MFRDTPEQGNFFDSQRSYLYQHIPEYEPGAAYPTGTALYHQPSHHSTQGPLEAEPIGEGEIPLEDPGKADRDACPEPSAPPPIEEMEDIPGYNQHLSPQVSFVAPPEPPSYHEAIGDAAVMENFAVADKLTEAEARDRLVAHVKTRCCWGQAAAKGMWFAGLEHSTAVHYALRTFLETRSTEWSSEPFRGQAIDGPRDGVAPAPWDIQIQTPEMFRDTVVYREVPHTASVRRCHTCRGIGRVKCSGCSGWGRNRCYACQGTGMTGYQETRARCISCEGSGHRRCTRCHGVGQVACVPCDATGKLKYFVNLTATFKTHVDDFILERTALPNRLIREVPGTTLFEGTEPLVSPIQTFPEQQVNTQSAGIVLKHRALAQTGRIWMQNHVIRGVPVFQCDCVWKDKEFQFFVYGDNRRVYTEQYPQTCCCCRCQLL